MFDLRILNARIVSGHETVAGNLYIQDGKVAAVSSSELEAKETVDARGRYVIPGVVDEHVHIIDMEQNNLGRFEMDSAGAAVAGVTTIMEMPLTVPASTNLEAFRLKRERAASAFCVDYALYGGAVPGNCDEVVKMHEAGAIGFKAMMAGSVPGMFEAVNDGELMDIYGVIADCGSTITVHAENDAIIGNLEKKLKAAGKQDMRAFFDSRPVYQENEAIQRAIFLNRQANCKLLIVHVSNPEGVDMIFRARCEGMDVHCETGPHYLNLCEELGDKIGPYMKFAPPARSRALTEQLWKRLAQGRVETIGSDHGGHLRENKERGWKNIWEAGNGAIGLETSLPVMLSEGVNTGRITINKLVEVMCENPCKLFGIFPRKGTLQVGADADLVLLDMDAEHTVDASRFHSFQKHGPFDGFRLKGRPVMTMVRGAVVAENGEVKSKPGFGKLVTRL